MWRLGMKYLGTDATGAPQYEWCCDKARLATDAVFFLDDGNREYDSDRTGFYIVGRCNGNGKHIIHPISHCPFCGAPSE